MSYIVTRNDIDIILARYIRALASNGIEMSIRIDAGSKANGIAWRIFRADTGYSAPGTSNGYLGMTKREAWDTLHSLATMAEDMAFLRSEMSQ